MCIQFDVVHQHSRMALTQTHMTKVRMQLACMHALRDYVAEGAARPIDAAQPGMRPVHDLDGCMCTRSVRSFSLLVLSACQSNAGQQIIGFEPIPVPIGTSLNIPDPIDSSKRKAKCCGCTIS